MAVKTGSDSTQTDSSDLLDLVEEVAKQDIIRSFYGARNPDKASYHELYRGLEKDRPWGPFFIELNELRDEGLVRAVEPGEYSVTGDEAYFYFQPTRKLETLVEEHDQLF